MKRLAVWLPALAFLAVAMAFGCGQAPEATTEAAARCDLKAASASAAERALAGCGAQWIDANVSDQPAPILRHAQLLQGCDPRRRTGADQGAQPRRRRHARLFPPHLRRTARQGRAPDRDSIRPTIRRAGSIPRRSPASCCTAKGRDARDYDLSRHGAARHQGDPRRRHRLPLALPAVRRLPETGEGVVRRTSRPHADPDDDQSQILGHLLGWRRESAALGQGRVRPHGRRDPLRLFPRPAHHAGRCARQPRNAARSRHRRRLAEARRGARQAHLHDRPLP